MCGKLVTNINWLSNYWKIKRSPDSSSHRPCSGVHTSTASSDMHIMLQVKCLQGYSRQISCCPYYAFPLVALLENSAFPFFFLNPFVFQFWSYLLSEVSLATQNKPKLPHPHILSSIYNISLSFYSGPSWCAVWDCNSKWVLVIMKIIFLHVCCSYSSKSFISILMSGILFQACIT